MEEDKKDLKKESKQCKPLRRTQTNSVEFSHERLYLQRGCQTYPAHHPLPLPLSRPLIFQIPSTPPLLHCNFPASKLDLQKSFCKQKSPRRTLPETKVGIFPAQTKVGIFPALHDSEPVQKTTILLSGKERTDDNATSFNGLQEFKKALQALMTCRRPDCYGTEGSPIFLLANHFLVKFDPMQKIFHYDVNISPRPSKDVARMIKRKLVMENSDILAGAQPAFDGRKNLYSSIEFQEERIELFVKLPISTSQSLSNAKQSPKLFRVCIRLVSKLSGEDLSKFLKDEVEDGVPLPQDYLQALDVVLREGPMENFISVGRSLYSSSMGVVEDIGGGAVGLRGFFQSLRPTQQGLALNVDFSVTAFHESIGIIPYLQKCFEFLKDLSERKSRGLAAEEKKEVERALKNIRIFVSHRETDQGFRIFSLTNEVAKNLKFRDRDGRDLTLIGYFKEHYNHEIQFKNLPCLQISRSKPCYLPMELCMICEGQKYLGKLSDHQTARILKMGCRRPIDRRNIINQVMKGGGPNSGCYADEFKLSVSREMTELQGRVLQPPKLKLGDGGNVRDLIPTRHDRQWNLLNSHVAEGSQIKRWALISFGGSSELNSSIPSFISQLSHKCDQLGIILNKTTIINPLFEKMQLLSNVHALESKLRKIYEASLGNLQLLMCVMEKKHKGYADLKRIAETSIGVVSQCCLYSNLSKLNPQFLTNLALKINAKLGGSNVTLYNTLPCQIPRIFADDEPAIFIGADVTHPHPLDDFSPSVAAVVGSMNWPAANKYISRMRSQTHRQEIIEELEQMVIELLDDFLILVYKLPMSIIFFRDGVSETQFSKVLKVELQAIKKACSKFPCYNPKITFAVVQKRHHTRLFMSEKNSSSAPFTDENIPPGTVVDTVITHPREFDFYLCSHWGMKGTSRPTHYHVLWDENRFKSDEIQKLIHNLCYTFVRCTKPVALVPPAYYAHLAAYRGKLYLERSDLRSVMQSKISRAHPPETAPLPKVRDSVKKLMFYC